MLVNSIDDSLNAFEEIAGVQSVEGRKTGKDICSEIADCVTTKLHIDFKNLVGVCTDGAPAMCIKKKRSNGCRSILEEKQSLTAASYINTCYAARF